MIEFNRENLNYIIEGLTLISAFKEFDDTLEVDLDKLCVNNYYVVFDWLQDLMSNLFLKTSESIAHEYITKPHEVARIIEEYRPDQYDWHNDNMYFHCGYDFGSDDDDDNLFDKHYDDYFGSLGLKVLKLYNPIVSTIVHYRCSSILRYVPQFVRKKYGISRCCLLDCVIEEDNSRNIISLYYFNTEYDDLTEGMDKELICSEFIEELNYYNKLQGN